MYVHPRPPKVSLNVNKAIYLHFSISKYLENDIDQLGTTCEAYISNIKLFSYMTFISSLILVHNIQWLQPGITTVLPPR